MMKKWQKQNHEQCPCCTFLAKSIHHMVICPALNMKGAWVQALKEYQQHLEKIQTCPQIIQELKSVGLEIFSVWKNPPLWKLYKKGYLTKNQSRLTPNA